MKLLFRLALVAGLAGAASLSNAQSDAGTPATSDSDERARIAVERQRLEERFQVEEAACYRRFFVNACLNDLRPLRREALADLRRQDILLNEVDRKQQAAEQVLKTEQKNALAEQQALEQAQKAQLEAQARSGRAEQRQVEQAKTAEKAAAQKDAMQARQAQQRDKTVEQARQAAAAAVNAEKLRERQRLSAEREAERQRRTNPQGPAANPLPKPNP